MVTYDFAPQIEGDTFEPRVFGIKRMVAGSLVDLTGASASFVVSRKSGKVYFQTSTAEAGIVIMDPINCILRVNEIKSPALLAGDYLWKLVLTYSDGDIKTYIGGNFPIIKNVADGQDSCN